MNNGNLSQGKQNVLTYLVYVLLSLLTLVMGYVVIQMTQLPETYVRLERYLCDQSKIEKVLERIERKIDRLNNYGNTLE